MAKFKVIAPLDSGGRPTYWNGESLLPPGTIVDIDTAKVKVAKDSKALRALTAEETKALADREAEAEAEAKANG